MMRLCICACVQALVFPLRTAGIILHAFLHYITKKILNAPRLCSLLLCLCLWLYLCLSFSKLNLLYWLIIIKYSVATEDVQSLQ